MTHLADITYVGYEYTLLLLPWMSVKGLYIRETHQE
jgi:hypothetical protein